MDTAEELAYVTHTDRTDSAREVKIGRLDATPADLGAWLDGEVIDDFLDLRDTYTERDLEDAILAELHAFILELGSDFAFVARQRRISIDDEDFYIDLLFFHRGVHRLIVVELKLGPRGRGVAARLDPVRRQAPAPDRAAGAGGERDPCRGVPDGAAVKGGARAEIG